MACFQFKDVVIVRAIGNGITISMSYYGYGMTLK